MSRRTQSLTGEPKPEGMKFVLDQVKKELRVEEVPVSRVPDFSLLKAAQKELGIAS